MTLPLTIRTRFLLAALLPVILIALLLAGVFLGARMDDLGQAHEQKARSLVRQIATASEYGLFSRNASHLQSVALGGLREADVRSVAVLDANGASLALAGQTAYPHLPALVGLEGLHTDAKLRMDLLVQPIIPVPVQLDDLYSGTGAGQAPASGLQGYVVMEVSRESLHQRENNMLWLGLMVTVGGLVGGVLLATRLSQGASGPVFEVFDVIERIGRGELSARVPVRLGDALQDLQQGVNRMAQRLETGRDELEQRVTEATLALREKKEEAESATLAKSRFLAAASHDLRQPTHALGMFIARLTQLTHDDETRHLIGNLDASVHALQDLLDALLDISRLDAGVIQVQRRPVAVAELFRQLQGALGLSAEDKGLRFRVRPTQAWLLTDPSLCYRVLLNLVTNAVRYTASGTVLVACRVARDGAYVRLEVRDTGMGIAPEHQAAVFNEFYQVGNVERDRHKGLGLGLNIVQRTVQLLGHELTLRSMPGQGTCFSLRVPLMPADAPVPEPAALAAPGRDDLAGLSVLVVEDDLLAREGMLALLASWGVNVRAYDGLQSALDAWDPANLPDVLVSDYRLPGEFNGMQVIKCLRLRAESELPACLISGDTDVALIQQARDDGLTLLHKPVRPAKLRSLLRRLSASARASV